jgi:hypothetical protein
MTGRWAALAAATLILPVLAPGQQPEPPLNPVSYYLTFVPGNKVPQETEAYLMRCLFGRCSLKSLLPRDQCPVTSGICENVRITEKTLVGGGSTYTVENWLTKSSDKHKQMFDDALDYTRVKDLDRARNGAWKKIRFQVLCHDQGEHRKREVVSVNNPAPQLNMDSDCVCK